MFGFVELMKGLVFGSVLGRTAAQKKEKVKDADKEDVWVTMGNAGTRALDLEKG